MIAERRRLAFAAFRLRPLDAFDRVVGDGVLLAEIFEQRGERREPVPDRAAAKPAPHQVVAPGDDVRARHGAKFLRPRDAGEAHEVLHRVFVGAAGVRVGEIGEPLDLGRHVGQPVELGGGQQPVGWGDFGRELLAHEPRPHDAARRHAGQLVRAAILGRQRVAIGAGRAAHDAALLVAGIGGGFVPGPVVGHRAFDGEHAAVVVGDDEVERLGGIGVGHGPF